MLKVFSSFDQNEFLKFVWYLRRLGSRFSTKLGVVMRDKIPTRAGQIGTYEDCIVFKVSIICAGDTKLVHMDQSSFGILAYNQLRIHNLVSVAHMSKPMRKVKSMFISRKY